MGEEEQEADDVENEWEPVNARWRRDTQLWLLTYGDGPLVGGYVIDYIAHPPAVFRWRRRDGWGEEVLTLLPFGISLIYSNFPMYAPSDRVREFTVEDLEGMDFEVHDCAYAWEHYGNIWFDLPGPPTESDPPT